MLAGGMVAFGAHKMLPAQVAGCVCGAVLANLMFSLPAVTISTHDRAGGGYFLSETVPTTGLILVISCLLRTRRQAVIPAAVGAYTGAAYFFTSFNIYGLTNGASLGVGAAKWLPFFGV
jgi:arsenate reductase